jgi:hypothetical protein
MRYGSKGALIDSIRSEHEALCALLREIPEAQCQEPGVWGEGWTIADLIAHLAEWQQMFLSWYREGLQGRLPQMPAPGYKWSQTPLLNRAIWQKHRERALQDATSDFESGYHSILELVNELSERRLLAPGYFSWTGKNPLTTYLGANTASHYRFAIKVIRRWRRQSANKLRTEGR